MNALQISNNAVASRINEAQAADLFHKLIINGDLSNMDAAQQIEYYKLVCSRVGLDAYQKPFDLLKLNGKLTLYANKTATAQLTALRNLKVSIVAREVVGDQYVVTARCETPSGGYSEDIGAVPIGNVRGDAASNAMKKASTQAKRRAILAACGLGMLDEEEVVQIRDAERVPLPDLNVQTITQQDEELILEAIALVESLDSADAMNDAVAYIRSLPDVVRDNVKAKFAERAKQLNLVWTINGYKGTSNGK